MPPLTMRLRRQIWTALLASLLGLVAMLAFAAPAGAAPRNLNYGFVEDQFGDNLLYNSNEAIRDLWWDRLEASGANFVRLNMYWSQVAPGMPSNPTNPGDPAYDFTIYDQAVREAQERGIKVVFTVFLAPRWAEGPNRDPAARIGTWRPNAAAFGQFAQAVAKRYSGSYMGLPRVSYFEGWNEPNLQQYLTPQYKGKKPVSPTTYRSLINAFYAGIKAVQPSATVIAAGTSPFGGRAADLRMPPYYFWRQVLCMNDKLKKIKGCGGGSSYAHFDVYATNPINGIAGKGPETPPKKPDEGVPSNFHDLTKIVRTAEKAHTILPAGKRPGWATETWYESNPPEKHAVSLGKQARFMEQDMYVLWRQGVQTMFFLQLRDSKYDPSLPPLVGFQTGIYLPNGKAKPSAQAVAFPFVADRLSKKKVRLWGIAPASGKVKVKSGKKTVAKIRAKQGKVYTKDIRLKGKAKLVASMGKRKSLSWKLRAR